jgi:hypothetical protein
MDERLKNIMDNLDARRIGLYESFKFHCTCYGKCCTHREDILLDPRDVYNMSRELGMSPEKLVKKYREVYAGEDSRVPIVMVKPKGHLPRPPAGPFPGRGCHRLRPALPHHSPACAVASPELTNTEGTPPKSLTGREKVSLYPVSVIASGLPQPDQ